MTDEFYVGYNPTVPAGIARFRKWTVIGLSVLALAVAALLVFGQSPFLSSKFEFQVYRDYQGQVAIWPYPILRSGGVEYLLVDAGKRGASSMVAGMDGKQVQVRGSLIQLGNSRMLEILPGLAQTASSEMVPMPAPRSLGAVRLTGEIADSKCHFGVMNPGRGKVHRDCAVRCISGGIPPVLLARDANGQLDSILLTGKDGRPLNREILDRIAERLTVSGELFRLGNFLVLKAEPADFRRE